LEKVFVTYWPQFEKGFQQVLAEHPPTETAAPREPGDILSEILANTRTLGARISRIEASQPQLEIPQSLRTSFENVSKVFRDPSSTRAKRFQKIIEDLEQNGITPAEIHSMSDADIEGANLER
jgi:hypothetical protein